MNITSSRRTECWTAAQHEGGPELTFKMMRRLLRACCVPSRPAASVKNKAPCAVIGGVRACTHNAPARGRRSKRPHASRCHAVMMAARHSRPPWPTMYSVGLCGVACGAAGHNLATASVLPLPQSLADGRLRLFEQLPRTNAAGGAGVVPSSRPEPPPAVPL